MPPKPSARSLIIKVFVVCLIALFTVGILDPLSTKSSLISLSPNSSSPLLSQPGKQRFLRFTNAPTYPSLLYGLPPTCLASAGETKHMYVAVSARSSAGWAKEVAALLSSRHMDSTIVFTADTHKKLALPNDNTYGFVFQDVYSANIVLSALGGRELSRATPVIFGPRAVWDLQDALLTSQAARDLAIGKTTKGPELAKLLETTKTTDVLENNQALDTAESSSIEQLSAPREPIRSRRLLQTPSLNNKGETANVTPLSNAPASLRVLQNALIMVASEADQKAVNSVARTLGLNTRAAVLPACFAQPPMKPTGRSRRENHNGAPTILVDAPTGSIPQASIDFIREIVSVLAAAIPQVVYTVDGELSVEQSTILAGPLIALSASRLPALSILRAAQAGVPVFPIFFSSDTDSLQEISAARGPPDNQGWVGLVAPLGAAWEQAERHFIKEALSNFLARQDTLRSSTASHRELEYSRCAVLLERLLCTATK